MKRNAVFFSIGILTALLTVVAGCTSVEQTSTTAGRLVINITDAPSAPDIEEIWLTVSKVQIHMAGSDETSEQEQEQNENDGGWIEVGLVGDARFNLLTLQNGLQAKLAMADLDPGKYTQIRMDVSPVEIKVKGDAVLKIAKLPSGTLKFNHPFEIVGGEETELLFDFDALKSVNVTGNDKYMFKPVIKLTTTKQPQPKGNLEITTPSLPNGEAGVLYTWSLDTGSALPANLALDPATGIISGTPDIATTPGVYTFTIKVVDGSIPQRSATKAFSIEITGSGVLQIITTFLPDGTEDTVYAGATLVAVGGSGTYSWELPSTTGFPAGLSLSAAGAVSGTPTDKGDYSFTVKVTDTTTPTANTDTQVITIRINKAVKP
jgi:hypothetical protein